MQTSDPSEFFESQFDKVLLPFLYLVQIHFLLQGYGKGCLNPLQKSGGASVLLYLYVAYVTVSAPPVCPFHCSASRCIWSLIPVQLSVENKHSCTAGSSQKFVWREEYPVELLHPVGRMHIYFNVWSGSSKVDKAVSVVLVHYPGKFMVGRFISCDIRASCE